MKAWTSDVAASDVSDCRITRSDTTEVASTTKADMIGHVNSDAKVVHGRQ